MKIICTPSPEGAQEHYIEVSCDSRTNDESTTEAVELAASALIAFGHGEENVIKAMASYAAERGK